MRSGEARCALEPGVHALGGRAADALALPGLEHQPRAAMISVSEDGFTTLQRTTASIMVRIDGETIGIAPVELRDGATIEFAESRLVYEAAASSPTGPRSRASGRVVSGVTAIGAATRPSAIPARTTSGLPIQGRGESTKDVSADAALVDVRSGRRHPLRARRIFIGRDDSCDIIVLGNSVSRRHASIAPVDGGFMLRDESANGTLVNGVRVVGTFLLGNGDVVRVQDEELRVELDASEPPPIVGGSKTTQLDLAHITRGVTEEQARAAANRVLTASLEIVRGQYSGACFQVERAVCSIGRGDENDVRIRDDTVSTTHATLLRKGDAWFVVDLRSMNGTFVDGSRVAGERQLHPGACVRVGAVELVFRAIDAEIPKVKASPRLSVRSRLSQFLRSFAPPLGDR